MYLLDTNVLSETRKRVQNRGVKTWVADTPADRIHLSVLTIGEVGRGITQVRERGDHRQATTLDVWLQDVLDAFGDNIVPVTIEIAQEWSAQSGRQPIPPTDGLIAATAKVHRWTL